MDDGMTHLRLSNLSRFLTHPTSASTSERRDDPFLTLLVIGATIRGTRLVTRDHITDRPRKFILRHLRSHKELTYLVGCPWCASFYVALAASLTALIFPRNRLVRALLLALTASEAAGLVAASARLDPPDPPAAAAAAA